MTDNAVNLSFSMNLIWWLTKDILTVLPSFYDVLCGKCCTLFIVVRHDIWGIWRQEQLSLEGINNCLLLAPMSSYVGIHWLECIIQPCSIFPSCLYLVCFTITSDLIVVQSCYTAIPTRRRYMPGWRKVEIHSGFNYSVQQTARIAIELSQQ